MSAESIVVKQQIVLDDAVAFGNASVTAKVQLALDEATAYAAPETLNPVLVNMAADTWTRLPDGPEHTVLQTKMNSSISDPNCSNLVELIPLVRALPLVRVYGSWTIGDGAIDYFGGAHSGYLANEIATLDLRTGAWSVSSYTPDKGCQLAGGLGPSTPTVNNRPWWEHQGMRAAWDKRLGKLMLFQPSGTWLYDRATDDWERATDGAVPTWISGDYLGGNLVFSAALNAMLWVRRSDGRIYKFNYEPYSWTLLHDLKTGGAQYPNPDGGNDAAAGCQGADGKIYFFRRHGVPFQMYWFDPATNVSGRVDMTNGPSGDLALSDSLQAVFPGALAYHPPTNEILVAGKAAVTCKLIIWAWHPQNGWSQWPEFPVAAVTESSPFELTRKVPNTGTLGSIHTQSYGMLRWEEVHNRLFLSLRHNGGGSTGQGGTNGGINPVTGVPLKSIEIYALKRAA
jgi:hypothetical protein